MADAVEVTFRSSDEGDLADWDAFVASSPQRSPFVHSAFLRALGAPFEVAICRVGHRIVAGAPIVLDRDEKKPLTGPHPFTMYQGVLLGASTDANHRRVTHELRAVEALAGATAARYARFCWALSWRFEDHRALQWVNYHEPDRPRFAFELSHTGVLDLDGFDAGTYLNTIRSLRKREHVRSRDKVEIRALSDVDVLDDLHDKTFARQGIARDERTTSLVRDIARATVAAGIGAMTVALVGGRPASAMLFLYDDRTAFYLIGANDPDMRDTGASTSLMLHMIGDAAARGLREVDFVGVNSPARGDYKTSFNARVRPYHVARFG